MEKVKVETNAYLKFMLDFFDFFLFVGSWESALSLSSGVQILGNALGCSVHELFLPLTGLLSQCSVC